MIVRDPKTGEPTGALKETARALVKCRRSPSPDAEARYALLLRALRLLNAQGITSVQDAGFRRRASDPDAPGPPSSSGPCARGSSPCGSRRPWR